VSVQVKLSEIVSGIESQSEEQSTYLDKRTGKVVLITDEEFRAAEAGDRLEEYPDWQHGSIKLAKEVLEDAEGTFLELPLKFDIHEYAIMERFCLSIEDKEISEKLHQAIKGSGAFRRFRNGIRQFGVAELWHQYRERAFRQIAIDWCEENGIAYTEDH
jgi:hypothetical protein